MTENPEQLPAKFGPYWLYEIIGKGGMAEIFLAKTFTALGTERQCVIKRILPQLNADVAFCEMLIKEAKLCARLSHANIVQTYELGQIEDQFYIAMEYVEGVDLNRLLGLLSRLGTALPLQFALYVIVEALRGLDYAHRLSDSTGAPLGIIHRDVSPTNVLISTEGEVKLCDFGIAKVAFDDLEGEQRLDAYHLKGKVAYMAPEHIEGKPIDRRADLYAAGILLWELLQGRRLYKSKDEDETLRRARAAEVPPIEDRGFKDHAALAAIAAKALARDPADRYQTGGEFIRALEDYVHATQQTMSQLKFADFLMENFGESLLQQRRERERHLGELMRLRGEDEATRMTQVRADITASLLHDDEDEEPAEPAAAAAAPIEAPAFLSELAKRGSPVPWIVGISVAVVAAAAIALKLFGAF